MLVTLFAALTTLYANGAIGPSKSKVIFPHMRGFNHENETTPSKCTYSIEKINSYYTIDIKSDPDSGMHFQFSLIQDQPVLNKGAIKTTDGLMPITMGMESVL